MVDPDRLEWFRVASLFPLIFFYIYCRLSTTAHFKEIVYDTLHLFMHCTTKYPCSKRRLMTDHSLLLINF